MITPSKAYQTNGNSLPRRQPEAPQKALAKAHSHNTELMGPVLNPEMVSPLSTQTRQTRSVRMAELCTFVLAGVTRAVPIFVCRGIGGLPYRQIGEDVRG